MEILKFVRLKNNPLPLKGLIKSESKDGKCWIVAQYGYSLRENNYWPKKDCEEIPPDENLIKWVQSASKNK